MSDPIKNSPVNPNPDYKDKDIRLKPIVFFLGVLTLVTVLLAVGIWGLIGSFDKRYTRKHAPDSSFTVQRQLPPEPRLIADEPMALEEFEKTQRAILDGYAVLDTEKEVVRIPIERAMELVAERGLPRWAEGDPP